MDEAPRTRSELMAGYARPYRLADLREAQEIEWESKSTGAALRSITGQAD